MPIFLQDVDDRRYGLSGAIPYDPANPDEFPASFPFSRWNIQQNRYLEYWRYFTGDIWNEEVVDEKDEDGNKILKYPLQINYIKTSCLKHNYLLWGEAPDTSGPLVPIKATPRQDDDETPPDDRQKKLARQVQNFVNRVWTENQGRILQYEGGLTSQYLGAAVFGLRYDPDNIDLENHIKMELILPDFFMPVWESSNPDNLLEAFIIWRMPSREAFLRFGYPMGDGTTDPLYIEHWTKGTKDEPGKINITLGGEPISHFADGEEIIYDDVENPFGFVPFYYIPRERVSFYGLSLVDDLKGMAKEMNARLADFGDVIHESAHRDTYVKNVAVAPKTMAMPNGRDAINLGTTNPVNGQDPTVEVVDPPTVADNLSGYPEVLRDQYGRDAMVPKVADGEDEGSQRSALTLAFRMWPMTSTIRAQRNRWTNGLLRIARGIVKMAIVKNIGGMTEEHLTACDLSCDWPVMIPRDREQIVNETVLAVQTGFMAPIDAIKRLSLVDDPFDAWERVKEYTEWKTALEAQAKAQQAGAKTSVQSPVAATGAEKEAS
jgi:hypothetical protein